MCRGLCPRQTTMRFLSVVYKRQQIVLYYFIDGILEKIIPVEKEDFPSPLIKPILEDSDYISVIVDTPENTYIGFLEYPTLEEKIIKNGIKFDLERELGEKPRFTFTIFDVFEAEGVTETKVFVVAINNKTFQEIIEAFKQYKDKIVLITPYPALLSTAVPSGRVTLLEIYEDGTRITFFDKRVALVSRNIIMPKGGEGHEDFLLRLREEIDRSVYYLKQNYSRDFEINKILLFTETPEIREKIQTLSLPYAVESLLLEDYRGGEIAPYFASSLNLKLFPYNFLPPVVSLREVFPVLTGCLLALIIFTLALFGISYNKIKDTERAWLNSIRDLQTRIINRRSVLYKNIDYYMFQETYLSNPATSIFLRELSAALIPSSKVKSLKIERTRTDYSFNMELEYENATDFEKLEFTRTITQALEKSPVVEKAWYEIKKKGDTKVYLIHGVIPTRKKLLKL